MYEIHKQKQKIVKSTKIPKWQLKLRNQWKLNKIYQNDN